jgi:hypothetical protein
MELVAMFEIFIFLYVVFPASFAILGILTSLVQKRWKILCISLPLWFIVCSSIITHYLKIDMEDISSFLGVYMLLYLICFFLTLCIKKGVQFVRS